MARFGLPVLLLLLCWVAPGAAQPARDRVLGDVDLVEHAESVEIRVGFNFPIRYLSHFPAEEGEELRIQLSPIEVPRGDREALFQRETHALPWPNLAGVSEILYEGDTLSGLYLTLFFQGRAHWQVLQGEDYRSLQIRVLTPYPSTSQEK